MNETHKNKFLVLFEKEEYPKLLAELDNFNLINHKKPSFLILKSKTLIKLGLFDYCLRFLEDIQEMSLSDSDLFEIFINKIICYRNIANYKKVRENLESLNNILKSKKINEIGYKIRIDYEKASLLTKESDLDGGLNIYFNLLESKGLLKDKILHIKILLGIGEIFWKKGELSESESFYNKALEKSLSVNNKECLADCKSNLGNIYLYKGDKEKSRELYIESLMIRLDMGNKDKIGQSYANIAITYMMGDKFKMSIDYFKKSLKIFTELRRSYKLGTIYENLGVLYGYIGEFNQAILFYQQAIKNYKETDGGPGNPRLYLKYANSLFLKGNVNDALENYSKALHISCNIGDKLCTSEVLNSLGVYYFELGELEKSLDILKQSLQMSKEIENKITLASKFHNLGMIYHQLGKYEKSKSYYRQAFSLNEELESTVSLARDLFGLIQVLIDNSEAKSANEKLKLLRELSETNNIKIIVLHYNLSKAYVLSRQERIKEKMVAQEIFKNLIKEKIEEKELNIFALLNLGRLLIEELRVSGSPEIIKEIRDVIKEIHSVAEENNSYWMLTEYYLLEANFSMVELDFNKARTSLSTALNIAKEKKLGKIAVLIENELNTIGEISNTSPNDKKEGNILERVNRTKLEDLFLLMSKGKFKLLSTLISNENEDCLDDTNNFNSKIEMEVLSELIDLKGKELAILAYIYPFNGKCPRKFIDLNLPMINKSTITKQINSLINNGFVIELSDSFDSSDKRMKYYSLTEKGKNFVSKFLMNKDT